MSDRLHRLFNDMTRFYWNTIDNISFDNGIYIVFENGETYHNMNRIVRVGTHNKDGRLRKRLKDHFVHANKDGSIFRKNVGKAILNKERDPYIDIWHKNSSNKKIMLDINGYDPMYQKQIESAVSEYMRGHFSFTCFPVPSMLERLRLEEGIIAEINSTNGLTASSTWLGNFSTEYLISQNGMWLKDGLKGRPLSDDEFSKILIYCSVMQSAVIHN